VNGAKGKRSCATTRNRNRTHISRAHIACFKSNDLVLTQILFSMGRPRKRQFIESTTGDVVPDRVDPLGLGSVPFGDGEFDSYMDGMLAEPYFTNTLSTLTLPPETTMPGPVPAAENGYGIWSLGHRDIMGVPPINFGNIDFGTVDHTPPLEPAPQLSTDSNTSVSSESSPPQSTGGSSCSCLASMYLSLASLQEFPSDIVKALRTVRSACATAAATIWCQKCGTVLLDNPTPSIESFQNVMLLGTILPIIANGYQRLLQMIDDEMARAESLGQTKTFRFHDYGGMCGQQTLSDDVDCAETAKFSRPVEMSPQQWRTTVRALLRVDIYGHEQTGFKHRGLKDLVAEMETRQKTRHEMLDAHFAALGIDSLDMGLFGSVKALPGVGGHGHTKCVQGAQPYGCLQILQVAKSAIDNLTIA
jgi:hypothetical protein